MLSRPLTGSRNEEARVVSTKKIYSRRPWYAPPLDPVEVLTEEQYPGIEYESDNGEKESETTDYYDPNQPEYEEPANNRYAEIQFEPSPANTVFEKSPTTSTVTGLSIVNGVNWREAAFMGLSVSCGVLALLLLFGLIFILSRRKNPPSPPSTPPILVYPPHDISGPCFMTKEVNFSLPALRSWSLGELRDVVSVSSLGSEILCPPVPTHIRSNSFTNTTDLGVLDPSLYKADCLDEDLLWPEGHVGRVWFTLKYESTTERLQVHVIKVKHLPSRTLALANACDPYVKIQLMPDERRVLQTKQKKKTCNPVFDETFVYQIPPGKLDGLTLKLSVLDSGRVGKGKQLIGHLILPLTELEGIAPDEEPQLYKMDIEKEIQEPTSDLGEIQVSLLYNENLHRLTVTVIEARGLKLDPSSTKRDMVVRVAQERACRGVRARRTAAVDIADDGSAVVSECFHFRLRADELHTTSVTVQALQPHSVYAKDVGNSIALPTPLWDEGVKIYVASPSPNSTTSFYSVSRLLRHPRKIWSDTIRTRTPHRKRSFDRLLGKFMLGSYMFARGRALQHWNAALAAPMEQVKQWHPLTN